MPYLKYAIQAIAFAEGDPSQALQDALGISKETADGLLSGQLKPTFNDTLFQQGIGLFKFPDGTIIREGQMFEEVSRDSEDPALVGDVRPFVITKLIPDPVFPEVRVHYRYIGYPEQYTARWSAAPDYYGELQAGDPFPSAPAGD